jgi:integrase
MASKLDGSKLKRLAPGAWVWESGIGYRRHQSGDGGAWYIKYRAPLPGSYPAGISPPMRQIKERLPNCRNRSQAEGVLMARKAAVFEGTFRQKRKAEPTTLASFAARFLESKRHLRTAAKYRQQLGQHLIPYFGKKPIEAITSHDCLAYYNLRLDTDAAVSTVNGEMACLKSLFSEAGRAGLVQVNPAKGIKLLNPNNVRDRILSSEETARLFAAAAETDDFIRPLFHLLFNTGMRLGEALALEWADIEFDHQRIVIRRSKSGEGRKVPLRSILADELIRWKPHARGSRWVFPARYDASKPMQSIRKGWLRLVNAAGVDNLRPHDLRHNFTSVLQAQGVADSIIMAITGHKTHVMLHRYSHAADASKQAAAELMPAPVQTQPTKVTPLRRRKR